MPKNEVDAYLAAVDEPKRSTLTELRQSILRIIPEAEECISYRMPAYKVRGKVIAGYAAFKDHLSYFPHSGSVLPVLEDDLAPYKMATNATLQFPVDTALPESLLKKLIALRLQQAFGDE